MGFIISRTVRLIIMISLMVIGSCTEPDVYSEFTDPRDNNTYRVRNVNGVLWFAEDLRLNDEGYSYQQGLNACPPGWSLPNVADWIALSTYFGGYLYNGQSFGDPPKSYNRMIEEFGTEEGAFYWTSTPAWDDVASIRSSSFQFNPGTQAVEYAPILIGFRTRCRCVRRVEPQSTSDVVQFTINNQVEAFNFYRIDHENTEGKLAVFIHRKLDENVTVNRVNFQFDLPSTFISELSPPVKVANVIFEQQLCGLDPWSMTSYYADPANFEVLVTFYDGSIIKGTFSGNAFDGTSIDDGSFELKPKL